MRVTPVFPLAAWALLLLTGVFSGFQVAAQGAKPTTTLHDLELGMPRDRVLAGLVGHYKLTEVTNPSDPSKGVDIWQVLSGDLYAGDVCFKDGKLAYATVNLYYAEGSGGSAHELVDRLFAALFDTSGQSAMAEGPLGIMTRSRSTMIRLDSVEEGESGNFNEQSLRFQIQGPGDSGTRPFILSVFTDQHGSRIVALDEALTRKWQGRTSQERK